MSKSPSLRLNFNGERQRTSLISIGNLFTARDALVTHNRRNLDLDQKARI
jgi:hypothetical protein